MDEVSGKRQTLSEGGLVTAGSTNTIDHYHQRVPTSNFSAPSNHDYLGVNSGQQRLVGFNHVYRTVERMHKVLKHERDLKIMEINNDLSLLEQCLSIMANTEWDETNVIPDMARTLHDYIVADGEQTALPLIRPNSDMTKKLLRIATEHYMASCGVSVRNYIRLESL